MIKLDDDLKSILKDNYEKQTNLMKEAREVIKKEVLRFTKRNIKKFGTPEFNVALKKAVLKKLKPLIEKSIKDGIEKAETVKKRLAK